MYALVEVSRFLTTMRTMSRSLRWGKRSLDLKDWWVYKDWLLMEFNKSFCWFSRSSITKFHEFHFISPHFTVLSERITSLIFISRPLFRNEVPYISLHYHSLKKLMKWMTCQFVYFIMNQENESQRQDLHMGIGSMKDSKTKPEESTPLTYTGLRHSCCHT